MPASASETTAASIADEIFKMYDIRGVAHETLRSQDMYAIGRAFGSVSLLNGTQQIVIACDSRESSPQFKSSIIDGVRSTGCDVIDIGTVATPVLYFATCLFKTGTGLMVTASHNPPEYNGVKMVLNGRSLHGDEIQNLKQRIGNSDFAAGHGGLSTERVFDQYCARIGSDVRLNRPLRIVVDCANGIGGAFAPRVLRQIGCDVIELFCDVDSTFPNHPADPTVAENLTDLIDKVQEMKADAGLALDADGDRMVAIAPSGEIIWPDRLMILFSQHILGKNPGRKVVFDVKCTRSLPLAIESSGGEAIMWKTGHSLMKAKMRECDAVFGGELSGHFFFSDRWPGFDDGIYAAARLCEILAEDARSPQEVFADLPAGISSPEIRLHEEDPPRLVELFRQQVSFDNAAVSHLDGIRADFEDGFGLLRASNTASEVSLRFEADSSEGLVRIERMFMLGIEAVRRSIDGRQNNSPKRRTGF
ncbi:MAG: phosphomannomutase/phosphoglucomutase [Acidiferrobacterales bacterium]|nr:phosphomannomutase/phosphoglucomutase [Acidiferrobacterales bacterium]